MDLGFHKCIFLTNIMILLHKCYHAVTYFKQLGVSARTMAATLLCRPLQNNNVKWPDSALPGEHEPYRGNSEPWNYLKIVFCIVDISDAWNFWREKNLDVFFSVIFLFENKIVWNFVMDVLSGVMRVTNNESGYFTYLFSFLSCNNDLWPRDYQDKRVNPPYGPSNQGNPSLCHHSTTNNNTASLNQISLFWDGLARTNPNTV